MPDVVRALAISSSLLLAVVVLIIIVSIVTVKRGEGEPVAHLDDHRHDPSLKESVAASATAPAAAAAAARPAPAKAAAPVSDEISVINIILIGAGLFVLTVVLLLGLSLVEHMR